MKWDIVVKIFNPNLLINVKTDNGQIGMIVMIHQELEIGKTLIYFMMLIKMNYVQNQQLLMQEPSKIIFRLKILENCSKVIVCLMDLFVLTINNQINNVKIMKLDIVVLNHNINVKIKTGQLGLIEIILQDMVILKL